MTIQNTPPARFTADESSSKSPYFLIPTLILHFEEKELVQLIGSQASRVAPKNVELLHHMFIIIDNHLIAPRGPRANFFSGRNTSEYKIQYLSGGKFKEIYEKATTVVKGILRVLQQDSKEYWENLDQCLIKAPNNTILATTRMSQKRLENVKNAKSIVITNNSPNTPSEIGDPKIVVVSEEAFIEKVRAIHDREEAKQIEKEKLQEQQEMQHLSEAEKNEKQRKEEAYAKEAEGCIQRLEQLYNKLVEIKTAQELQEAEKVDSLYHQQLEQIDIQLAAMRGKKSARDKYQAVNVSLNAIGAEETRLLYADSCQKQSKAKSQYTQLQLQLDTIFAKRAARAAAAATTEVVNADADATTIANINPS